MPTKTIKAKTKPAGSKTRRDVAKALEEVLAHVQGRKLLQAESFPDIASIRKATGLSRAKFAKRFALEQRTLQDWEQGRRMPDSAARAYLTVIARNPKAVERALVDAGR